MEQQINHQTELTNDNTTDRESGNFDYPEDSAICWDGESYWSEHDFSQGPTCTRCGEKQ